MKLQPLDYLLLAIITFCLYGTTHTDEAEHLLDRAKQIAIATIRG